MASSEVLRKSPTIGIDRRIYWTSIAGSLEWAPMRRVWWILLLAACEPGKRHEAEDFTRGLQDVHEWDPSRQAAGFYAYDEILRLGEEAVPVLVDHLLDETATKIMAMAHITIPNVGDVCFHILLRLYGMRAEDFAAEGVVVLPQIANPIFAVRFDPGARLKVQARFRKTLK